MAKRAFTNLSNNLPQFSLNTGTMKRQLETNDPSLSSKRMRTATQENQVIGFAEKIKLSLEHLARPLASRQVPSVTTNEPSKCKPLVEKSAERKKPGGSKISTELSLQLNLESSVKTKQSVTKSVDFRDVQALYSPPKKLPLNVDDYDRKQLGDIDSEPNYAYATFEYYFQREQMFIVPRYMTQQKEISKSMRSILIDWIVEVQDVFQLNHESIYLAVKLVDMYLSKEQVPKSKLQLLGCTALFIAAKYDERVTHGIDSYVFVCDKACTKTEIIEMEKKILVALEFDIGCPLSYRFMRRFARCARVKMEMLTFARYILEMSLMEYDFVDELDSRMAAASLLLAFKSIPEAGHKWDSNLEFYSHCSELDLMPLVHRINKYMHAPKRSCLKNIKNKYSSSVFFSVAKLDLLPLLPDSH